jgi:beta-phosphoglucomutase
MTQALAAIIFDFDGVIADSERLHLRAYQLVFAPLGLQLDDESYYAQYLGYDDVGVLRAYSKNLGLDWDERTIAALVEQKGGVYDELSSRGEMLFPGAAPFIRRAAASVPIAIASGALTDEIEEVLARAGLRELFEAVVGADQTARSKPSPDPYWEAFHRLNRGDRQLDPLRTVAIEDSRWGLVSAATAGLRCVAVTNTYSASELEPHAELIVSGLDALTLDALDALCASPPAPRRGGVERVQP